jgi:hypothetical protein
MTYKTDNIAIAAALRVFGHNVDNIEIDGRKGTFCFTNDIDEVEKIANDIQLGKKLVDALHFHNELRRLAGLVKTMHPNHLRY